MRRKTYNTKSNRSRAVANNTKTEKKAGNKQLPKDLSDNLESSFGQDFSNVALSKNSQQAKRLNAHAFAKGENIHFAPGQFNPSTERGKNLIGHEFTHIVQQRNGLVKPTIKLGKRLLGNEDRGLENEADYFGKKAAKGEPVSKYRSSSLGIRNSLRTVQAKSEVVQRAVSTWGGKWDTDQYDLRKNKGANGTVYPAASGVRGVDIKLKFTPQSNANAKLIGLTQSVQGIVNNKTNLTKGAALRNIKAKDAVNINTGKGETDVGTAIDRLHSRNTPIYGSKSLGKGKGLADTAIDNNTTKNPFSLGVNATYRLGFRYKTGKSWKTQDAMLYDTPTRSGAAKNSRHIFETTALALKGTQAGTYYGSVRWGWRTDSKGSFTKIPLQVVSQGTPSSTFMKAAQLWNTGKTSSGGATIDLPIEDVKLISNPRGVNIGLGPIYTHLPFGTRVVILPGFPSMLDSMIRVVDGPYTGETGVVPTIELADERN